MRTCSPTTAAAALCVCAALFAATAARADVIYDFGQSDYTVGVGGRVAVPVT